MQHNIVVTAVGVSKLTEKPPKRKLNSLYQGLESCKCTGDNRASPPLPRGARPTPSQHWACAAGFGLPSGKAQGKVEVKN